LSSAMQPIGPLIGSIWSMVWLPLSDFDFILHHHHATGLCRWQLQWSTTCDPPLLNSFLKNTACGSATRPPPSYRKLNVPLALTNNLGLTLLSTLVSSCQVLFYIMAHWDLRDTI
jgi:hypothetical protein